MSDLASKKCVPCEGGVQPFTKSQAEQYLPQVPGWELEDRHQKIERKFKFKNFAEALEFVNKIGVIAESESHHPDIEFGWGYAEVELSTHAIKGLSENDFILAAKINKI
ncbi:MAG: pterin-4-alpha-carbinolamine dehydratase [Candidatus Doudnabacteria bacterium RIFCSPLOWO2_12_FULL_47_12]|nr:MAG: pterin-4-alpha-carbinolamine dehydratase [Candidatus Doudnabacteria bacterium RIFCSPLOWO2_12_FULL_47_12]